MAVIDIKQNRVSVAEWGPGRRVYNVEYRVTCDSSNDAPATILNSPQVPKLYSSTYGYGTAFDQGAICTSVGIPRRDLGGKSKLIWILDAEYTFDVKNDPDYQPVTIVPFFRQTAETVNNAAFRGWWRSDSNLNLTPITDRGVVQPELSMLVPQPGTPNPGTPTPDDREPTIGPVSNSAKTPVVPAVERRKALLGYRVSWVKRSSFNFDPWINTTNDSAYTLTAVDKVETEHEPSPAKIIFQRTFLVGTLLLADVQTEVIKIYDRLHYRYTLEFWASLYQHIHFEIDRGLEKMAIPEVSRDADGDLIVQDKVPSKGRPLTQRILGIDGKPVNEPVLMDGMGAEMNNWAVINAGSSSQPRPENPIWLAWQLYPITPFSQLPIGDTS